MAKGVKRGRASRPGITLPSRHGRRRRIGSARPISSRRAVSATRPRPQKPSSTLRISLTRPAPAPSGIGDPKRLFLGSASMGGHGAGPPPSVSSQKDRPCRRRTIEGFAPTLEITRDRRDGTITIHGQDRTRATIGLTRRF